MTELLKQDRNGDWWILRPSGKYEPGFLEPAQPPKRPRAKGE